MPGLVPRLAATLAEWPVRSREGDASTMFLLWATNGAEGEQQLRRAPGGVETALLAIASAPGEDTVAVAAFGLLLRALPNHDTAGISDVKAAHAASAARWLATPGLMGRAAELLAVLEPEGWEASFVLQMVSVAAHYRTGPVRPSPHCGR